MKLTRKQIVEIIKMTRQELKGTHTRIIRELGRYIASGANWSYTAGWTADGDLVVTMFGEVL